MNRNMLFESFSKKEKYLLIAIVFVVTLTIVIIVQVISVLLLQLKMQKQDAPQITDVELKEELVDEEALIKQRMEYMLNEETAELTPKEVLLMEQMGLQDVPLSQEEEAEIQARMKLMLEAE